jgi:small subunit ribosomal protein S11
MAQTRKKVTSKKDKNSFTSGVVHIQSTFNNTIVTITNLTGDTISWLQQEVQKFEKYSFCCSNSGRKSSFRGFKVL